MLEQTGFITIGMLAVIQNTHAFKPGDHFDSIRRVCPSEADWSVTPSR